MMKDLRTTASNVEATADNAKSQSSTTPRSETRKRITSARRFIIIMFMMALTASAASAQMVTISVSPLQISKKVAQLTGELKILDNVSVAGVAGLGSREGELVTVGGGQVRVYLSGGFNGGVHVGAEALFTEMGKASDITGMIGLMNGTTGGPFVGYKHVFPFGLTLDLMGGVRFNDGRIETSDAANDSKYGPMANVNVGWSF